MMSMHTAIHLEGATFRRMTLGYLFIRYLWYNKEQQFVMSTEKKMGHDHEYECFLELKV